MIKANELRIGNFVKADGYYPYADIDFVCKEFIGIGIDTFHVDAISPIEITEEWLMRFGFEWSKIDNDYRIFPSFDIQIIADVVDGLACCMFYTRTIHSDYKPIYNTITNVHQLQNLYFALTGKELTLTK